MAKSARRSSGRKSQADAEEAKLRSAIESLEDYAQQHISPIQRIVDLGRRIIAACLAPAQRFSRELSDESDQKRMLDAIAVIKTHYLQRDTNPLGEMAPHPPKKPPRATIGILPTSGDSSRRVSMLFTPWLAASSSPCDATLSELDLFRVKAISLIRNHPERLASLQEALEAIRQTPIVQEFSESPEEGRITLRQTLQICPEWIVLEGSFQRNAHGRVASLPLPESFQMSSGIHQTGCPLPVQHNGWALSERLLPSAPSGFNGMPSLQQLLQQRDVLAEQMRSDSAVVSKAKRLIALKKQAFSQARSTCLELHRKLAERLVQAAGDSGLRTLRAYFTWLLNLSDAYERLSQFYQVLNDAFVGCSDPTGRERATHWIARQQGPAAAELMMVMGPLIEKGSQTPESLFGRQLQHAFLQQLSRFLEEFNPATDESLVQQRLLASLKADIRCFKSDPLEGQETLAQRAVTELTVALRRP